MSQFYRHYKKREGMGVDGVYKVVDVVRCAETKERMVVYESLYEPNLRWVRRESEFFGEVQVPGDLDGETRLIPRFAPLDEHPCPDHSVISWPV